MSIRMVTYPGEVRTALNDAVVYNASVSTGALSGCDCSLSGNEITIANGFLLIQGRLIEINSEKITIPFAASGTLKGRVYVRADIQNTSAPAQLLYVTGSTLPALEQSEDINIAGGVYELELCMFTVGTVEITDLKKTVAMIHGEYAVISESGTSANDYTSPGIYTFSSNYTPTELPDDVFTGWLMVIGGRNSTVRQFLLKGSSIANEQAKVYTRTGSAGAWTGWARFVTEDEVFYLPGDKAYIAFGSAGYITGGTADVRFRSPWPKLATKVKGVKFISGTITIRQNNKYLADSLKLTPRSGTSGNAFAEYDTSGLWITVTKNGGFGGVNNDTVGITGGATVEFT